MRVLEITTNVGCANYCEYCPQDANIKGYRLRSKERVMKLETFVTILSKLPLNVEIFFCGSSEPFLNPQCMDMIRHCHAKSFRMHVYTTLIGVTLQDLRELKEMKPARLIVHVPSSEFKENFFATDDYIEKLRLLDSLNIENLEFMSLGNADPRVKANLSRPVRQAGRQQMTDFAGNVKSDVAPHGERVKGPIYCVDGREKWNVVYPNGDVTLCCEDFGFKHLLGNLVTSEYASLHRSKEYLYVTRAMKNDHLDVLCRTCEYAREDTVWHRIRELKRAVGAKLERF